MGEFDRDLAARMREKYDPVAEQAALSWIAEIVGKTTPRTRGRDGDTLYLWLKDGVNLCHLINSIRPNTIPKIVESPTHVLEERQNIQEYLKGCKACGVPDQDMFTIGDLHSKSSLSAVLQNIYALGRQAQVLPGFTGPTLGVKYSITLEEQQKREQQKREERQKRAAMMRGKSERQLSRRIELEKEQRDAAIDQIGHVRRRSLTRQLSKGRISLSEFQELSSENLKDLEKLRNSDEEVVSAPVSYGLDLEIKKQREARYDVTKEDQVMDWIEAITGTAVNNFYADLKNGILLCKLINTFKPNMIARINVIDTPIAHRDNIQMYLNCCFRLGVSANHLFTVNDLYEKKDLQAVINSFFQLSKRVETLRLHPGPFLKLDGSLAAPAPQTVQLQATRSRSCSYQSDFAPAAKFDRREPVARPVVKPSVKKEPAPEPVVVNPNPPTEAPATPNVQIVITEETKTAAQRASVPPVELPQAIPPIQIKRMSFWRLFSPLYWISCAWSLVDLTRYSLLRG